MRRSLDSLLTREWDVLVVGTGMGGSTLGWALAGAGLSVLFVERGSSHLAPVAPVAPAAPVEMGPGAREGAETPSRAGLRQLPIRDESAPRGREFVPLLGSGTGGSSALFGMLMERLLPEDFLGTSDDALQREAWPIAYAELEPYYRAAEELYRLRGSPDPLRGEEFPHLLDPPALTAPARRLSQALEGRGLHPYRPHLACEFVEGCPCCQGFLCPRPCKNDAARTCLAPALADCDAQLLDRATATGLSTEAKRVAFLTCRVEGRTCALRGRIVVLAAGALETPRILLASRAGEWPSGVANRSGLVGTHLMRHLVDVYAPVREECAGRAHKELAFNDFCRSGGPRLGAVQSLGPSSVVPPRAPGSGAPAQPLLLASILEDAARSQNRVLASAPDAPTRLRYALGPSDRRRLARMRGILGESLAPLGFKLLPLAEENANWGHACGTCRFGEDPGRSVLDRDNRAHDLDNLFVVDSSFMPSSGGVGPALTVAANALRVAERIRSEYA